MLRKLRNRKGFTLVELMIVVAIIGILAAIAIPNFLSFRMKAKTAEAKSNLGAIRSTEVAYFAEWDFYIGSVAQNPAGTLTGSKRSWATNTNFSIIGFAPEGNVYYGYALEGGSLYQGVASIGFTAAAYGDLDADLAISSYRVTNAGGEPAVTGDDF